ncbi:MAG: SAM-dependent methyltransferase [Firmicutes bacterium HGW-Firmicutes-11]|jgi:cyclopropane-fatty-acyl-phospholipid synthase|nr:MAG: SAM-dependent methyltransferase [Firmicutes bacterium HGW-Firmicutes-11]
MLLDIKKEIAKKFLSQFDEIPFEVELLNEDRFTIGTGSPVFKVKITKPITMAELRDSTSLALGEAYMDGGILVEGDLFTALTLVMSHSNKFSVDKKSMRKLLHTSTKAENQKKEVTYHYDIGNDFYKLWLGNTLNYSCAYFKTDDDTLDQAQENKTDHLLKKLHLAKDMHLLDIGCGWGHLLIKAAKEYGVKSVGITLSEEQARESRQRVAAANLSDLVDIKVMDYRDLMKSDWMFDRIVSVGMIEHVGRSNYDLFLKNVDKVLKPGGLFLLHYISALKESDGDPWIRKYIFPGGTIPSLREIVHLCGEHRFFTLDVESLRRHYTKTLLCWHANFLNEMDTIKTMFDDRFIRMWELYLVACAANFNCGGIDLHQILMSKGTNNELPLTRPY